MPRRRAASLKRVIPAAPRFGIGQERIAVCCGSTGTGRPGPRPCVATNPGNLPVAALATMRAFAPRPNSGEFGYLPETAASATTRPRWRAE